MASDHHDPNLYSAPASELGVGAVPPSPPPGGVAFAAFLLVYFLGSFLFMAVFWAVFWSLWMSVLMKWDFLGTLVFRGLPGGLFVGGLVSVFITGYLGLFMRRKTTSIPFRNRGEFVDRVDGEMKKRRYRPGLKSEETLIYLPKALIRTGFFNVFVSVGGGEASVSGPGAVVNHLSKRLRQDG